MESASQLVLNIDIFNIRRQKISILTGNVR